MTHTLRPSNAPRRLVYVVSGVLLLLVAIHFAGIYVLRYAVEKQLHPDPEVGTYIGHVNLNGFTGLLEVEGFELKRDGRRRIALGEAVIDIDPWALLSGRIEIELIRAARGEIYIDRREDGSYDIGLPTAAEPGDEETGGGLPPIVIEDVRVERFAVHYRDGDIHSSARLERVHLEKLDLSHPERQVPLQIAARLDGANLAFDGTFTLGDSPVVEAEISLDDLDLAQLARLARQEPVVRTQLSGAVQLLASGTSMKATGRLSTGPVKIARNDLRAQLGRVDVADFAVATDWGERGGMHFRFDKLLLEQGAYDQRDIAVRLARLSVPQLAVTVPGNQPEAFVVTLEKGLQLAEPVVNQAGNSVTATRLDIGGSWQFNAPAKFAVTDGRVEYERLDVLQGDYKVATAALKLSDVNAVDAAIDAPKIRAALDLKGLTVNHLAGAYPPLTTERLQLQRVAVDGDKVDLEKLLLKTVAAGGGDLQTGSVELDAFTFDPDKGIALGNLLLRDWQTAVTRTKEGGWQSPLQGETAAQAPATANSSQQPDDAAADNDAAAMAWRIASVSVAGDSHIVFTDASIDPPLKETIRLKRFQLSAIDSRKPTQDTSIDLEALPDAHSVFSLKGTLRPLQEQIYLNADGEIAGIGLATFNGMVGDDLGHHFEQGQLENIFSIRIESQKLEMSNALTLDGLEVIELEGKEGPPLATAIALLEDKRGRITIEVPVTGDLTNPDFSVVGALNPIITKAVAGAAALAIQPLGSVLLVGALLADSALAVSFDPAQFDPKSANMAKSSEKYLKELAAKLEEKPKLSLRICGVATEIDRTKNKKGEYVETEEQLLDLAKQRADAVRAQLTGHGVAAKRLRNCRPVVDSKPDGTPRVDIKF